MRLPAANPAANAAKNEKPTISVLVKAILSNKLADVAAILSQGCDVDGLVTGHSPLFYAVMAARPEIVHLLLEHGADWRKRDRMSGWTPLMMATINVHRSPRRRFTARAIKDSRRVVKILSLAGAKDHEAKLVLGHYCDEPGLIAAVVDRKTQANQQVIELDGAIVVLPPRMLKKLPVAFDTIEDHARKLGMRRLLKSLAPTHPRRPSRRQRRLTGD